MSDLDPNPVSDRETLTQELLGRLREVSELERARITAEVVKLNLPLCESIVKRYLNRGADRDDLAQVARVALLLAIRRFDPAAGSAFAAFAVPTILGEIKRHFRDASWVVRPPRPLLELRAKARTAVAALEQSMGRQPNVAEIADYLGVAPAELREALQIDGSYRPWSLDPPDPRDWDRPGIPEAAAADPSDLAGQVVDRLMVRRLVATLADRDRKVVVWRFEEGLTQQQIAERLGISQMQVSRILRRILDRLRHDLQAA